MELPRFGENKIYTSTISEQLFYTVRVKDNIVHIRYGDVDIGTEHCENNNNRPQNLAIVIIVLSNSRL